MYKTHKSLFAGRPTAGAAEGGTPYLRASDGGSGTQPVACEVADTIDLPREILDLVGLLVRLKPPLHLEKLKEAQQVSSLRPQPIDLSWIRYIADN